MARAGFIRRHKVAVASNTALVLAAGAVIGYAVAADGYQAHKAELNDGGIWVVNSDRGLFGRINKPINQLDTTIVGEGSDRPLDIVQDGAAVAAIDRKSSTAQVIDPSTSKLDPTGKITLPGAGDQQMAGGSFASIDIENGDLWAVQLDPQRGRPLITTLDSQGKPRVTVGESAALAVTQSGTVVATSQEKSTITYVVPSGDSFDKPRVEDLPEAAGAPTSVTAVGETVVTLDQDTGALAIIGGPSASMPEESVLQQPGPDSESVLVANPGGLVEVDLESGATTVVDEGRTGRPIEPVRLGACSYAAWSGGIGSVSVRCGDDEVQNSTLGGKAGELAFRVNRGQIVLNDNTSGTVWDLDTQTPEKIDNWNAFTMSKKSKDDDKENQQQTASDRTPPKAEPDSYGARAGRTTVLHPLDNDSAPEGRLLSITDIDQPTGGATAEISPDGQTIVLALPEQARDTSFDYYIDDGRSNSTAHATVRVGVRSAGENEQPGLRNGFEPRTWRVAADSSASYPVLSDWRDDGDGDSLVLESAAVLGAGDTGAVARTTSDGRIRFTGSRDGGDSFQVEYQVSDGRSAPVTQTMSFEVQERLDRETYPAIAEPDVVRGEVDRPIKIRPLLNDLPGSDPGTPNAELALGGKIPVQNNTSIKTDLESGVVTFSASQPGTYFLDYGAAYGDAALDKATVRVDVRPRPKSPGDPVAMPDSLTVFGQAAGIVDVLANDLDPAGGLLVVQSATPENSNQMDVAIIDGRWLRISARQGDLTPNPQIVRYTISNGAISARGEVSVSHRAAPADNSPVTTTDRVHVRAGSSVTAAVLDNDIAPSGDRLSLVNDTATGVPGELKIERPVDVKGDIGVAMVSGRNVRYIAPDLKERDSFEIAYIAQTSTGEKAPGRLVVIVTPEKDPNTAPEPPTLESRVVSGGQIKIKLPGSGIDPDGDPVTVNGITSAPRLGRVLGYGGNFLEYQAYPRTTGTDEFEYSVVDSRGAVATGTVRVGIAPPGEPQPLLAVADQVTIAPGRTAVFDPMANDYFAPGDKIKLELRDAPEGVSVDPKTNLVSVPAPDTTRGETTPVVYTISNGISIASATMTLELSEDFENPPVVSDAFGVAGDSDGVSVDVLEGAYDPDGDADDLTVVKAYGKDGTGGTPIINGSNIRVNRGPNPVVVPFRVEDADGAAATASLYVPPTGAAIPYVKPGVQIELDEGGSAKGKLKDYVINPSGGPIRLTARQSVTASPADLQAQRTGDDSFEVTARGGYRGPGALLLEVTTATDEAGNEDPQDPEDGYTALLSVPVQVGDDTPVLECPQSAFPIAAGESRTLDILTLCNVFTPDPADAPLLDYDATWAQEVDGLTVSGSGSQVLTVEAADDANRGGEAVLSVTANGSEPATIRFLLDDAPPPDLLQIPSEDMNAGQSRQINLGPYLQAGVADPTPTVVSIEPISGSGVSASRSGSAGVTLNAAAQANGRVVFRVVMSDVADSSSADRRVEGRIEVDVSGVPGQPGRPYAFNNNEEGTVRLGWAPPKETGGSPITSYVLKEMTRGKTTRCRTNLCDVPGLENQREYNFRVAAVNKVGQGDFSELSQTAYADTKPGRVSNVRMLTRGDGTITLGWSKPQSTTTIKNYRITWLGQSVIVAGTSTSVPITGLNNNQKYVFSVSALNSIDWSPKRESIPLQSIGTPAAPGGLAVVDREAGLDATDVSATWTPTLPEGPAPTFYTLSYSVGGGPLTPVPGCGRIQATTCTHTGVVYDGSTYSYVVQAANIENTSPAGTAVNFQAVGKPAKWGPITVAPTGEDNVVLVTGVAPESRGEQSRAAILVAGGTAWELDVPAGRTINERVRMPNNDAAYAVQLRMCNEFAATVGCSFSDPVNVQSYGPLTNRLNQPTASVDGLNVTWTISGSSNGNAAVVGVSIDGGPEQLFPQGSSGAFSFTRTVAVGDYSTDTGIRVRLFDDNPGGRGESTTTASAESGPPPPPSISISKGAKCSTSSDGSAIANCSDVKGQGFTCEEDSCAFVNVSYDNPRPAMDCRVEVFYNFVGWQYVNGFRMEQGSSPASTRAYWGETGRALRVSCSNGSFTSNEIGW